jgi:hypothetical protein
VLAASPLVLGLLGGSVWWPPLDMPFGTRVPTDELLCAPAVSPCEYVVQAQCPWGSRAVGACFPRNRRFPGGSCSVEIHETSARELTLMLTIEARAAKPKRCGEVLCSCEYQSLGDLVTGGFAR